MAKKWKIPVTERSLIHLLITKSQNLQVLGVSYFAWALFRIYIIRMLVLTKAGISDIRPLKGGFWIVYMTLYYCKSPIVAQRHKV